MVLRIVGVILIIIGLIIFITGVTSQDSESLDDEDFGGGFSTMFLTFIGIAMMMFGGFVLYFGFVGGVAKYYADEVSPAIETGTEAFGAGLSRGIQRGGGLKIDLQTTGQTPHRAPGRYHTPAYQTQGTKEVIRIKCRNCGYLETEDADFCSKCGKNI
jgi:hypothetical protein